MSVYQHTGDCDFNTQILGSYRHSAIAMMFLEGDPNRNSLWCGGLTGLLREVERDRASAGAGRSTGSTAQTEAASKAGAGAVGWVWSMERSSESGGGGEGSLHGKCQIPQLPGLESYFFAFPSPS